MALEILTMFHYLPLRHILKAYSLAGFFSGFFLFSIPLSALAVGVNSYVPIKANNVIAQDNTVAAVLTEMHVNLTYNGVPSPQCSNGGSFIPNSMMALPNANGGTAMSYSYACIVKYTNFDIKMNNGNYSALRSGWVTNAGTDGGLNSDLSTTQYATTALPQTTFYTDSNFYFMQSDANNGHYAGWYSYNQVQMTIGGSPGTYQDSGQGPGKDSNNNYSTEWAGSIGAFLPYATYSFTKKVIANNWTTSCQGYFTMLPEWVGKTVYLNCCYNGYPASGSLTNQTVHGYTSINSPTPSFSYSGSQTKYWWFTSYGGSC